MFTGIVECVGKIVSQEKKPELHTLVIESPAVVQDMHQGDSIAVNGVCLTVVEFNKEKNTFSVQVVPETLSRTNLGNVKVNEYVNLERSLLPHSRMGGHFVQGHVDIVSKITAIETQGDAWLVTFSMPEVYAKYIVNKGFIAIDGMSITVIDAFKTTFTVTLIPFTIAHTIAKKYHTGTEVNLEIDIMAKYIERGLEAYARR